MMTLLIVDDEEFVIQGILDGVDWRRLDFDRVLTATNFAQVKKIFTDSPVDVLVCDIEMPMGSGMDIVSWVTVSYPETVNLFLTCHMEFDYMQQAIRMQCMDYILKPVPYDRLEEILGQAADRVRAKRRDEQFKAYGKRFVENLTDRARNKEEKPQGMKGKDCVDAVERYIMENISEDLSVERIARIYFISPDHLTRLFHKEKGETLIDFIIRQRMILAARLLEAGELSITLVAASVGYNNYPHFTKMFRKFYGKSPREYMQEKNRNVGK